MNFFIQNQYKVNITASSLASNQYSQNRLLRPLNRTLPFCSNINDEFPFLNFEFPGYEVELSGYSLRVPSDLHSKTMPLKWIIYGFDENQTHEETLDRRAFDNFPVFKFVLYLFSSY